MALAAGFSIECIVAACRQSAEVSIPSASQVWRELNCLSQRMNVLLRRPRESHFVLIDAAAFGIEPEKMEETRPPDRFCIIGRVYMTSHTDG
jgi:hypothetical protein